MISGDTDRRTYTAGDYTERDPELSSWPGPDEADQKVLAQRAIGFNCLNYARPPEGTLERHYLPTKEFLDANCANGLRMEIMFPSCWKGEGHIDSPNHKDHVAFPHLVKSGDCPKDYSERLSSLLYEIIWNTAAFKGRDGKFVFSNDDDTGALQSNDGRPKPTRPMRTNTGDRFWLPCRLYDGLERDSSSKRYRYLHQRLGQDLGLWLVQRC